MTTGWNWYVIALVAINMHYTPERSWFVWPLFPLFLVYFIAGVAETPFDRR